MNFEPGAITSQAIVFQDQVRAAVNQDILSLPTIKPCLSKSP